MSKVDYEVQFLTPDDAAFAEMESDARWTKRMQTGGAADAFRYVRWYESEGVGVAFAKYRDNYYVWVEEQ